MNDTHEKVDYLRLDDVEALFIHFLDDSLISNQAISGPMPRIIEEDGPTPRVTEPLDPQGQGQTHREVIDERTPT